jgi:hypothetical protein
MKSIEITEQQQNNLLEICEFFFNQEYNYINFENENIYFGKTQEEEHDDIFIEEEYDDIFIDFEEPIIEINWFQFCLTILAPKLYKNNTYKLTAFYNRCLIQKQDHIVNILYQEFLKQKHTNK